ncbi:unnamed protein product [Rotaria sp. Silwood1]|nr:unnamed protein product [Rotaria sp. Silwood1]CAF0755172.1 unnamed protein product [Rotaria sp. Silwood1]CAF3330897.1 unnamed protein product [Rotaria sp. Silwood1]CAF4621409.1 unnamed protein product [Rotaria sp. Silwood1]CAF4700748.1 unnamed protein product [Rotaria sp. Silwood1]
MGSSKSMLKRSMIRGDEIQVLQVYRSRSDIRRHIDPNLVLNEDGDTFVHYASHFAMKTFLRKELILNVLLNQWDSQG